MARSGSRWTAGIVLQEGGRRVADDQGAVSERDNERVRHLHHLRVAEVRARRKPCQPTGLGTDAERFDPAGAGVSREAGHLPQLLAVLGDDWPAQDAAVQFLDLLWR